MITAAEVSLQLVLLAQREVDARGGTIAARTDEFVEAFNKAMESLDEDGFE